MLSSKDDISTLICRSDHQSSQIYASNEAFANEVKFTPFIDVNWKSSKYKYRLLNNRWLKEITLYNLNVF